MARSPLHMPCMLDCEITVYFMIVISYRMAGRFRPQLTRFLGLARVLELVLGRPPCVASIWLTKHAGQQARRAVAGALYVVSRLLMMLSPPNMQPASPEVKRKPRRTLSWPDMRQEDSGGAELERPPGPTY